MGKPLEQQRIGQFAALMRIPQSKQLGEQGIGCGIGRGIPLLPPLQAEEQYPCSQDQDNGRGSKRRETGGKNKPPDVADIRGWPVRNCGKGCCGDNQGQRAARARKSLSWLLPRHLSRK